MSTLNVIPVIPLRFVAALALLGPSTVPAYSHEFWVDPVSTQVEVGEPIAAAIRVGERFKGTSYSYIPKNVREFGIDQGGQFVPAESRAGDRPAMTQAASGEGLAIVVHVTADYTLTYREGEKFRDFVTHKDAAWALEDHARRGLPEEGFSEAYSRYAKALVAVGDGEGQDRDLGLLTEITALANPYTDDVSDGLPVRVTYQGEPRGDVQVEIFEKAADDTVTVSTVRTDEDGRALVPVSSGHRYMIDAVVIREPDADLAEREGVSWESLWANLTFEVPAR